MEENLNFQCFIEKKTYPAKGIALRVVCKIAYFAYYAKQLYAISIARWRFVDFFHQNLNFFHFIIFVSILYSFRDFESVNG